MSVISPNMNLPISTIGTDSGLIWEQNLNASLNTIDTHDHTPGKGVQITPAGLNINATLTFNGQIATGLQAVQFTPQSSSSSLGAIYVSGANLFFNDTAGNVVQITSGGAVNATSSGIASGTATASFVSGVLVVNSASLTPANIQGGSLLLGNNVASSNYLTLSPPNSMPANYSLVLPSIPGSTSFMTIDTSGNMAGSIPTAGSLTTSNLSPTAGILGSQLSASAGIVGTQLTNQTITATQIANNTITRTQEAAVGQQISSSCGTYSSNNTSPTPITNLSVTITTSGRPVMVFLQPDNSVGTSPGVSGTVNNQGIAIEISRGASRISEWNFFITVFTGRGSETVFPSTFTVLDTPAAGTYTYTVAGWTTATSGFTNVSNCVLVAYEL